MLDRTTDTNLFLTANELHLFEEQHDALIKALNYMETGRINSHDFNADGLKFDMSDWLELYNDDEQCGTACCIGGTACWLGGNDRHLFDRFPGGAAIVMPRPMFNLFFKPGRWDIDVPKAAKQLREYLTTGECSERWACKD